MASHIVPFDEYLDLEVQVRMPWKERACGIVIEADHHGIKLMERSGRVRYIGRSAIYQILPKNPNFLGRG